MRIFRRRTVTTAILCFSFVLTPLMATAEDSNAWRLRMDRSALSEEALEAELGTLQRSETAQAAARLGYLYREGLGVEKDLAKARSLFEKSAAEGDAFGLYNLGYLYGQGSGGLQKDVAKALELYQEASEGGDIFAPVNLGFNYQRGIGVEQDYARAVSYYAAAAEAGNPLGINNLGAMYMDGKGVDKDPQRAVELLQRAALAGATVAAGTLGDVYRKGKAGTVDYEEAARWYRLAAEDGRARAQYELGTLYLFGRGLDADESEGLRWLREAAEQGHEQASARVEAVTSSRAAFEAEIHPAFLWSKASPTLAERMTRDMTFEYIPEEALTPLLVEQERGRFRPGNGTRDLSLEYNGAFTQVKNTPTSGYSEWWLPDHGAATADGAESWRWITISLALDAYKSLDDYEVPLQFRTSLSGTNKIELTLNNEGQLTLLALDRSSDDKLYRTIGGAIEVEGWEPTQIDYVFSSKGFYSVFVNGARFDGGRIPAKYVVNGAVNRLWLEGTQRIYTLAVSDIYSNSAQTPTLSRAEIAKVDQAIADYFENVALRYYELPAIQQHTGEGNDDWLEIENWKYVGHERIYLRRGERLTGSKQTLTTYRGELVVVGAYSNDALNGFNPVSFPVGYEVRMDEDGNPYGKVDLYFYGERSAHRVLKTDVFPYTGEPIIVPW